MPHHVAVASLVISEHAISPPLPQVGPMSLRSHKAVTEGAGKCQTRANFRGDLDNEEDGNSDGHLATGREGETVISCWE